jgi:hypothetical protein
MLVLFQKYYYDYGAKMNICKYMTFKVFWSLGSEIGKTESE